MKLCIVGVGLLGGSFSLALKEKGFITYSAGVDISAKNGQIAVELGIADEILSFEEGVAGANLTILATPVNIIQKIAPRALDLVKENCWILDVGSTKESICEAVKDHPKRSQFIATHPIAGTENTGPEAAFPSLLTKKIMIFCETQKSNPAGLQSIVKLCQELDMRIRYIENAADHDRHLAYVSHLSHISSFALGSTVLDKEKDEKAIFDMAGSGFSSTVRLAKSSPEMWAPIFTHNTKNISEALDAYIKKLQYFKEIIDLQDEEKTKELMLQTNEIRRVLKGIDDNNQ